MITALSWIPKGVTPAKLEAADSDESLVDQYLAIIQGDRKPEPQEEHPISAEDAEIIAKYNLDNYDDYSDDEQNPQIVEDDKYIVKKKKEEQEEDDEDDIIRETDLLLIVGKSTDPDSSLEVHIFDEQEESFYPHHEFMIPSFPLSIAWMDGPPGPEPETPGGVARPKYSFCAISSMLPHIEIWNLNVAESPIPCGWLQQHTDAIPSLSWNPLSRRSLLSCSVDGTAIIWHLDAMRPAAVFNLGHPRAQNVKFAEGKSIQWNPKNAPVFGVGTSEGVFGYDVSTVGVQWSALEGESIDTFAWLNDGRQFLASTENGDLYWYDIAKIDTPIQVIKGHDNSITSISVARYQPRQIVATTDINGRCVIWDLTSGQAEQNQCMNMGIGEIFSSQFSPDVDLLLAVGGGSGETKIWNVLLDLDRDIGHTVEDGPTESKGDQDDDEGESA